MKAPTKENKKTGQNTSDKCIRFLDKKRSDTLYPRVYKALMNVLPFKY